MSVHTVHDCSTGLAEHTPLSAEELAEHEARSQAHAAEQAAAAEHRTALLETVQSSPDPAIGALVELLGVA